MATPLGAEKALSCGNAECCMFCSRQILLEEMFPLFDHVDCCVCEILISFRRYIVIEMNEICSLRFAKSIHFV